jgi:hypothetical protein
MEISIFGDKIYTKTTADSDGNIFVLLTPEFIKRFEQMELYLSFLYRNESCKSGNHFGSVFGKMPKDEWKCDHCDAIIKKAD